MEFHAITNLGAGVAQQVRRKSRPFLHTFKKDIDNRSCMLKPKIDRKDNIESDGKLRCTKHNLLPSASSRKPVATASAKPIFIDSNNATSSSIEVENNSGGLTIHKFHSMGNLHGKSARNKGMPIETGMNVDESRQRVESMATIKDTCNDQKRHAMSRINKEECEE